MGIFCGRFQGNWFSMIHVKCQYHHVHTESYIQSTCIAFKESSGAFNFLLGMCRTDFQKSSKVGPRERIFVEKCGVLGTQILNFWQKQGWKCKIFLKIEKKGKNWKKRGTWAAYYWRHFFRLGSADCMKQGVMTAAHLPTTFQCKCPQAISDMKWWMCIKSCT